MKKKIRFFIDYLIKKLSCIVVRTHDLYVFGAWFGEKYADNSKALFEYYIANNKKCVWITKNKSVYKELRLKGIPVEMRKSFKGIFYQLRAGTGVICCGDDIDLRLMGNATVVQLWHGVGGGKKNGYDAHWYDDPIVAKYHILNEKLYKNFFWLGTSECMIGNHISGFHLEKNQFIHAGQPRNDIFFEENYEHKTIPKELLDKNVILYAPTHRKGGKEKFIVSSLLPLDMINDFCEQNNMIFVIKKHFYNNNDNEDFSKYKSIVDFTKQNIDINELLMISKCLITDYSSISADYLLLDKPIIYFCFDYNDYIASDRDLYWQFEDIQAGDVCTNGNEVVTALKEVLIENKDAFKERRRNIRRLFYADYSMCKAAPIIYDFLEEVNK